MRVPDGWDSEGFASFLLEECGVSFAPGSFFGRGGEGYVCISLTTPEERIAEAIGRMDKFRQILHLPDDNNRTRPTSS